MVLGIGKSRKEGALFLVKVDFWWAERGMGLRALIVVI